MTWISLSDSSQITEIDRLSHQKAVLLFKHSTRCSISTMALSRMDRQWFNLSPDTQSFLLDLLTFKELSDNISEHYKIAHESPQVLVIRNGKCIYHASHNGIIPSEISVVIKNN